MNTNNFINAPERKVVEGVFFVVNTLEDIKNGLHQFGPITDLEIELLNEKKELYDSLEKAKTPDDVVVLTPTDNPIRSMEEILHEINLKLNERK